MNGKTHTAVGICAAAFLLVPRVDIKTSLIGLGFVIIGSYATDADLKVSKAGQVVSDVVFGVIVLATLYLILTYKFQYNVLQVIGNNMPSQLKLLGAVLIVGSIVLGRITGHRKYMHSLIGFVIMNAGVWLISGDFVVWFALGYALHIIIDLLNEKPESLLFPFSQGDICFSLCSSNGIINWIISMVAYVGFFYRIISIYNLEYLHRISAL